MAKLRIVKKEGGKVQIKGMSFRVKRPKKPTMWNPMNWIPSIKRKKDKPTGKDL